MFMVAYDFITGEDRLNRAISDLRAVETERRENAVDIEKRRCEELETNMAALKQSFLEQQGSDKERLEAANHAIKQLEENEKYQVSNPAFQEFFDAKFCCSHRSFKHGHVFILVNTLRLALNIDIRFGPFPQKISLKLFVPVLFF